MSNNQELLLEIKKLRQLANDQAIKIADQEKQLQIKSDAIRQQTEDIKKLDGELIWNRAALYQAEHSKNANAGTNDHEATWQEKYVRLQAEMENLRKRWEHRATEKTREERNRILMDMLPLADHLELALKHNQTQNQNDNNSSTVDSAFIDNIRATLSAFMGTLQRYNVERIDALGHPFDPALHEAIGQASSAEIQAGHVTHVTQTGYRDGERLLRPARVMVSTG